MFCFVPILAVFRAWIHTERDVMACALALYATAAVIAVLGIFEFVFPGIAKSLPTLFPGPVYTRSNFGGTGTITLSGFSAWGTPVVGVVLVPAFGFWMAVRKRVPKKLMVVSTLSAIAIVVGAVLSGYRSAWGGMMCIAAVLLLFDRRLFAAAIFVCVIVFSFLPQEFFDRLTTMWMLGSSGDTSLIRRESTLDLAMMTIQRNPLWGVGWGSFSTFNDYAYLALSMGIPSLLFFSFWYASNIRRMWRETVIHRRLRLARAGINPVGFLAALIGYLFCMMSGAMSDVPPLMVQFWLMFCLVLRYTEVVEAQRVIDRVRSRPRPEPQTPVQGSLQENP
jgi:O-antigen ligase